jgi:hypothetical protein
MCIGWALVGWCGTRPPKPSPEPLPGPNPWIPPLSGILGGILGGFVWFTAFSMEVPLSSLDYATTCIGAFVGGFIVSQIIYLFTKREA